MEPDLIARQRSVQRGWTPESHWHIGDLAWQRPSLPGRTVEVWRDPDGEVAAWAWLTPPGHLELQAPPGLVSAVPDTVRWTSPGSGTVYAS